MSTQSYLRKEKSSAILCLLVVLAGCGERYDGHVTVTNSSGIPVKNGTMSSFPGFPLQDLENQVSREGYTGVTTVPDKCKFVLHFEDGSTHECEVEVSSSYVSGGLFFEILPDRTVALVAAR